MSRPAAIRRCLRLIDAGASIEHVVGEAYNAGHVEGSGVSRFTDAESDALSSLRLLPESDIAEMIRMFPALGETLGFLSTENSE